MTVAATRVRRRTRRHYGVYRVPFKGDEILVAMAAAWESAVNDAEPGTGNPAAFLRFALSEDLVLLILHGITVRVLGVEQTVSPEYRFAIVEVTGTWVDHEGERHVFYGEEPTA